MKFTDGFWQLRPGVTAVYAQEAYDIWKTDAAADGEGIVITAPTQVIDRRGDTLNRPVLTVTLSSPLEGVVRVRVSHHTGRGWHGGFELPGAGGYADAVAVVGDEGERSRRAGSRRASRGARRGRSRSRSTGRG